MEQWKITTIITILSIVVTLVFSYIAFSKNKTKDDKAAGHSAGAIASDVGYIKAGIDELKQDNRETKAAVGSLSERVTRCEESCKQAHHRLDDFSKIGGDNHAK